jgi:hypothetical protein
MELMLFNNTGIVNSNNITVHIDMLDIIEPYKSENLINVGG